MHILLQALALGKAPGQDDVPPEFWKVLGDSDAAMEEILSLCQACWKAKDIPNEWRVASVVLLFKKGDATLPAN